jgi:hypothetical protein
VRRRYWEKTNEIDTTLDEILTLQITVAWAGEGACAPSRLGWWRTDLIDAAGGGDLMNRLLPMTHAWACLEAVREAALRADAKARAVMSDPDKLRTLFFLGFDLNERLAERLAQLKRSGAEPGKALPLPFALGVSFSPEKLAGVLCPSTVKVEHKVVPGGRQVKGAIPDQPVLMVRQLAAALVPFADKYPLPFYKLK